MGVFSHSGCAHSSGKGLTLVSNVFTTVWTVHSWRLLFCKIEDAGAADGTKSDREDTDAAFDSSFFFDVEITPADRTVAQGQRAGEHVAHFVHFQHWLIRHVAPYR